MPPPIRTFHPPTVSTPQNTARTSDAARQAQRAFFQQALGNAAPAQATQAPAAVQTVAPVRASASQAIQPHVTQVRTQPIPDEKPMGYRRPGSFVDIKV